MAEKVSNTLIETEEKVNTSDARLKVIIAGGGTGGHIFPAIAIAKALQRLELKIDILFVGARGRMEMERVPQAGYEIKGLEIAGFNRSSLIKNISLPWKLVKSFFQVRQIFKAFSPDAVIGVGGYSSFPVLRYAQAIGVPSFIHEANSFAGKSNILLGKKATKVFVATDGMEQFFPTERIQITGNPVRAEIVNVSTVIKKEALSFFGLSEAKRTVLFVGGSLGAKSINEAVAAGLSELVNNDLQVIWQTGKMEISKWKEIASKVPGVYCSDFIQYMEKAYAAADIVVSRSGAMAIAELCVVQKPVIFVPFPYASEDHQTVNALNLVKKNAAMMIKDSEAVNKVVTAVIELSGDDVKMNQFKNNIGALKITDADVRVASEVLKSLERK